MTGLPLPALALLSQWLAHLTDPEGPPRMTTTTPPVSVRPEIERDRFGRPLVVPPTGGKKVPYTRCTTFVGCIEDTYKLGQWQQRHVAQGLAHHDDLIAAVRDQDPEDKNGLNALVEEAKERSGAGDASRMGTYLHAVCEAADRGEPPEDVPLPWLSTGPLDPTAYLPDLAAYLDATAPFKHVSIEQFSVQDPLKIGGTPDRVVRFEGKKYIADIKTGSIRWGYLKIAAQLAVYARSRPYDVATNERLDHLGVEVDKGIIVHLPAGTGECQLYWVDLLAGWDAVRIARDVREKRSVGYKNVVTPLAEGVAVAPPIAVQSELEVGGAKSLEAQITEATTAAAVRAVWSDNARAWTPELTDLAKRHIASLA